MNSLTELRTDVANVLTTAGIKAVHYNVDRYTPPLALVVPDDNYVTVREGDRFGSINVAIQVLLIGDKWTAKLGADKFDEMILDALKALGDEFDIVSVSAPSEVVINEEEHYASIIAIEVQIHLGKDN